MPPLPRDDAYHTDDAFHTDGPIILLVVAESAPTNIRASFYKGLQGLYFRFPGINHARS